MAPLVPGLQAGPPVGKGEEPQGAGGDFAQVAVQEDLGRDALGQGLLHVLGDASSLRNQRIIQ